MRLPKSVFYGDEGCYMFKFCLFDVFDEVRARGDHEVSVPWVARDQEKFMVSSAICTTILISASESTRYLR